MLRRNFLKSAIGAMSVFLPLSIKAENIEKLTVDEVFTIVDFTSLSKFTGSIRNLCILQGANSFTYDLDHKRLSHDQSGMVLPFDNSNKDQQLRFYDYCVKKYKTKQLNFFKIITPDGTSLFCHWENENYYGNSN